MRTDAPPLGSFYRFSRVCRMWHVRLYIFKLCRCKWLIGSLSKRGRQRREARKIRLRNPRILLSIYLLWLPCMFLFSLKFR